MAFVPENPLEDALLRATTDPLARPQFYRLLVDSPLAVLGRAEGERHDQLTIPTLRHNGREYLPVFSAPSRLKAFTRGAECEHFTMAARALFETARGANIALNPNAECGKTLMASEIAYWLDPSARARRRLRAAQVRLGPPKQTPETLVAALSILFRNRQSVAAAHLLEVTPLDGSEPPHPLIGIETHNWPAIAGEVSELAAAIMPETIIDLMPIDTAQPEAIAAQLARVPPFYRRTANTN